MSLQLRNRPYCDVRPLLKIDFFVSNFLNPGNVLQATYG